MVKKNRKLLLFTSILILLPLAAGLALWNVLPQRLPTHWNAAGEIDGWSGKAFGVFFLPLFLLGCQWFLVGCMCLDPNSRNLAGKGLTAALGIMPGMSLVLGFVTYATALGLRIGMNRALAVLFGVMFLGIGNRMPKFRPSYTLGIRLPWTLASDENWRRTHRFAGKIWMVSGLAVLLTALKPGWFFPVLMVTLGIDVLLPLGYSVAFFRREKQQS